MTVMPFNNAQIACFLSSALREGWLTDQQELQFLLHTCPDGCLVFFSEDQPAGFITSLRYEKSAWIGNLLVLAEYRHRGIGRVLIEKVLDYLERSGCETVWLTASAQGAHLYRSLGFRQIDEVQRWKGIANLPVKSDEPACSSTVAEIDSSGWGDSRPALYDLLTESRAVMTGADGFLACYRSGENLCIGPWGARSSEAAARLLSAAIGHEAAGKDTFCDAPAGNRAAGELLRSKGFSVSGTTLLMYRGKAPAYRAETVYALASMGSYG